MVQSKSKWNLWTVFLPLLAGSLAVSLTMRVFSFYTLPHVQKVLVLGWIGITLGLAFFRFVVQTLSRINIDRKRVLISLVIALGVTGLVLGLLPYHPAPIRTRHALTITNPNGQGDLALAEIKLPGDQNVDFAAEFPDADRVGENLILTPGQSLSYSREMVGGVVLTFAPLETGMQNVILTWDGQDEELQLSGHDEDTTISLPGWTWGEPSLVYRLLGWVNILADGLSLAGIVFWVGLWFLGRKDAGASTGDGKTILLPYTIPIVVSLAGVVLAGLNQLITPQSPSLSLILFAVGMVVFIPFVLRQYPKWLLRVAIGVIGLGIAFNVYVIIHPFNDLQIKISIMEDESFAVLAQKAGASTYLSMGYYRYFRDAELHIPAALLEELSLFASRLETMNVGSQVLDDPYDYILTTEQADALLARSGWEVWPKEGGGDFYLHPGSDQSARVYYFFKSGDQYFLLTRDFMIETGIIDVPLSD